MAESDVDPIVTIPGGFSIPVPHWAKSLFALIASLALAMGVYRHFYPAVPELVTAKQANHLLRLEVREYNRHIMAQPMATFDEPNSGVSVRVFDDGCMVIARRRNGGMATTRLFLDPEREDLQHEDGDELPAAYGSRLSLFPVVSAQGRCVNPHPGPFQWRYGDRLDRCWVQVWRTFEDSCTHVHLFNTCTGSWDTLPDGSPNVHWTRCVH